MNDERTQPTNEGEVRSALARLLGEDGVPRPEEAYTAKVKARASGHRLYVIVASPGVDAELEKVILAATGRQRSSACGIWVLADRDASELVRYSSESQK